jgi:HSP20 family molecular chaperone IbpA
MDLCYFIIILKSEIYMKVLFILCTFILSLNVYAQSREEIIEEFMRERSKMMEEIQKMFQDDFSGGDSFFGDSDIDSLFDQRSFSGGSSDVKVEQKYEEDGSISILITPQSKNVNLDINTKDNMVTIKGETQVVQEDEGSGSRSKVISKSSFSKSVSIPSGYKAQNPKQEGKSIKISLLPQDKIKKLMVPKSKARKKIDKVPVGKLPGEETI